MDTTIGENLKRARNLRGLSQDGLAELADVNNVTVWATETGRSVPRPSTLRRLAKALGLEVADLMIGNLEAITGAGKKALAPAPH